MNPQSIILLATILGLAILALRYYVHHNKGCGCNGCGCSSCDGCYMKQTFHRTDT